MKKGLLVSLVMLSACSSNVAQDASIKDVNTGKTVITVNGEDLNEGYLDMLSNINPRIKAQLANSATRRQFLENLAEQELLFQEARKRGLDKKEDVIQKAAVYKKIIISQALLEDELKNKAKSYYDTNKEAEFTKKKISLIQVNFVPETIDDPKAKEPKKQPEAAATAAQKQTALERAKALAERVKKGEDFAKVAQEASDDKTTKKKGGDFGPVSVGDKRLARRDLQAVGEAAFKLQKDQVSDPIETKKAYYIVKVTSDPELTPYDEAEKVLRFQLQKDAKEALVADLKKNAKIEYNESNLTPPEVTAPMPMPMPVPTGEVKPGDAAAPQPQFKLPDGKKIEFKPNMKTEETAPAPTPAPAPETKN